MENRIITVVSTRGDKIKKYDTNVSTWGELKSLIAPDYELNNLKAVENINKTVLQLDAAILPTSAFRLFLRPDKTESGADFNTLRTQVSNNQEMKEYLRANSSDMFGKHWTQLTTEELEEIIKCYYEDVENNKDVGDNENDYEFGPRETIVLEDMSINELHAMTIESIKNTMGFLNVLKIRLKKMELPVEKIDSLPTKENENVSYEERDDIFNEMSDLF